MKFEALASNSRIMCDGVILPYFAPEDAKIKFKLPAWTAGLISADEFAAKAGQLMVLRLPPALRGKNGAPDARAAALVGLGPEQSAQVPPMASAYAYSFGALKNLSCATLAAHLPTSNMGTKGKTAKAAASGAAELSGRIATQLAMADYAFDKYKPKEKEGPKREVKSVGLVCRSADLASVRAALLRGQIIADAANFTRRLQNEPANVATPDFVAKKAQEMAKKSGLSCTIFGPSQLKNKKMNALLAVSSGSIHEPRFVMLHYRGNPSKKNWDVAYVGKGVTFDSGGISIKPSSKMDEMKFDKSGACAVIGTMSACRALKLKLNVVGIAALVENMPSGSAYRPGDILSACNGTTMEILNTDAEGRVVLADALAYASKNYKPSVMVDIATLTGACVVALGDLASGVLSENDALCEQLISAGEKCGERLWRLPMWPEYDEKVKSEVATVKNIGESGNAGITAGASFLKPFAGEGKWAHLDIAGTANTMKSRGGLAPGGTGIGVRLMLEYLSNYTSPKADKKKK